MCKVLVSVLALCASSTAFSLVPRAGISQRASPALTARAVGLASPALPLAASPRAAFPGPVMMAAVKETSTRSLVKAVGWRFTAGVVTATTSMIFTGSLATAASIVGWDLCSKSVTMFLGERIWNNFDWGKTEKGDSNQRSLAKAIAWRIFAATNTLFAALVLTKGKAGAASKIAGTDSIVKTILFYFYERVWAVIGWGKYLAEEEETAE